MPRPTKCRKVCNLPTIQGFAPGEVGKNTKAVILTIDEYETIRLIDREGFSQEECSASMQVARTTVQQIYTCARRKLATAIVDGIPIRIEGGNYQVCSQEECSASMQVARTTVQQIYTCARRKLATAIVDGIPIRIEGGNYQVCDGRKQHCRCCGCKKLSLLGHPQEKKQEE